MLNSLAVSDDLQEDFGPFTLVIHVLGTDIQVVEQFERFDQVTPHSPTPNHLDGTYNAQSQFLGKGLQVVNSNEALPQRASRQPRLMAFTY